ncbi:MAG: hypothetical protein AAF389_09355 [Gemmatimonadota bacterium]
MISLAPFDRSREPRIRAEAQAMAESFRDALLESCAPGSIDGVYVKGSAYRPWDSAIDYVPGVSDVDIHVRISPAAPHPRRSIDLALAVGERARVLFRARNPRPVHVPRAQLIFLDEIESMPGYLPSPVGSVRTLHGTPYLGAEAEMYRDTAPEDRLRFDVDRDFVLVDLPGKVVDRPGLALWNVIERLTWRVGPTGPRVLTQLGADPFVVWATHRTAIVNELVDRGCEAVAEAYIGYYEAGWKGFESSFQAPEPARDAIEAATRLFVAAQEVVERSQER